MALGQTADDKKLAQERLLQERAAKALDFAEERGQIKAFCADNPKGWGAIAVSLFRRREQFKQIMMSETDLNKILDARAAYRELTWLMDLPNNI